MTDLNDIPGLLAQDKYHHYHPQTNPVTLAKEGPGLIDKAEGIYVYTADGKRFIDARSGGYCTNIGYSNDRLCEAAYQTMKQLSYSLVFDGQTNRWAAALSEKLASITPESFQHFFFGSTGSDAVESAIKIALYYWRQKDQPSKRAIIARRHSYHGLTLFASSLTGIDTLHQPFGLPITDLVYQIDAPYRYAYGRGRSKEELGLAAAATLEKKIQEIGPEKVAAFIGEPIQASDNFIIPPANYWPQVQRICEQYDILLIADEVVTGFGKTGKMFGFQSFGFEPDMFTMAKGISSGYFPVSSVGIGSKVSEVLQQADEYFAHGFTNCGHPVGSSVALENINVIEQEHLVTRVREETGPYFSQRLNEFLQFPFVGEVRSLGIMGAIDIDVTKVNPDASLKDSLDLANRIGNLAWENGLSARPVSSALALVFPMIITKEQIDDAVRILQTVFEEISKDLL